MWPIQFQLNSKEVQILKVIVHPKIKILSFYSPSCHPKPDFSFFSETQKKILLMYGQITQIHFSKFWEESLRNYKCWQNCNFWVTCSFKLWFTQPWYCIILSRILAMNLCSLTTRGHSSITLTFTPHRRLHITQRLHFPSSIALTTHTQLIALIAHSWFPFAHSL